MTYDSVLYLKELYKFISSMWSKNQQKEKPLRALKGGKMPLNIFLQASKQQFWPKMQCTDLFNHVETPLVSTAMHWITEIADTVPEGDRN